MSKSAPSHGDVQALRSPVIVIDADERPILISPGLRLALGLGSDAPLPLTLGTIMDEASASRVHSAILHGGDAPRDPFALRLRGADGAPSPAAVAVLPTTGGGAVLVVSLDPDPWSDRDAAILLEHSQDMVFSLQVQPGLAFRYVNTASDRLTGYGPDELRSDPSRFAESIHPEDRALVGAAFADGRRLQAPVRFRFRHRSGEWRWFELLATPVTDGMGRTVILDGTIRDITTRSRLEEQFRLLIERSPEMVYRIRLAPDCATDYMSPACESVTGRSREEFYRDPWLLIRYVHPDDRHIVEGLMARPGEFCGRPLLFRLYHPDGSVRWTEQVNVAVFDGADRLVAIEGVCRDVTERQEVEATLQGVNRRMNLLASLTRHDILNQLTVLLGSLELAGTAENATELAWFLGRSREAAWAIHRLTEFTRDYQEIGQGAPTWVPVPALLGRVAASFAGGGVAIEVPDEPLEILADPLIEQVFYNLVENALRHGGTVERVRFSVREEPSGGAVLACEDDGAGVPLNEKERIFERGYGRNTGLGLYLSSEILATTGMTIVETGRPGIGARFEIRVPPDACRRPMTVQEDLLLHYR